MSSLVTIDEFAKAISERTDMELDESRELASNVLGYFGFNDEVLDHHLDDAQRGHSKARDTSARTIFYILDEAGLVKPDVQDGEEYFIVSRNKETGELKAGYKRWSITKWKLRVKEIKKLAANGNGYKLEIESGLGDVYAKLPEEAWTRAYS